MNCIVLKARRQFDIIFTISVNTQRGEMTVVSCSLVRFVHATLFGLIRRVLGDGIQSCSYRHLPPAYLRAASFAGRIKTGKPSSPPLSPPQTASMLPAVVKLCCGISYPHVRNMAGERSPAGRNRAFVFYDALSFLCASHAAAFTSQDFNVQPSQ